METEKETSSKCKCFRGLGPERPRDSSPWKKESSNRGEGVRLISPLSRVLGVSLLISSCPSIAGFSSSPRNSRSWLCACSIAFSLPILQPYLAGPGNETLTLTHQLEAPEPRAAIGQSLFLSLSYQTSSSRFPVLHPPASSGILEIAGI